jgi:hypothetical protein
LEGDSSIGVVTPACVARMLETSNQLFDREKNPAHQEPQNIPVIENCDNIEYQLIIRTSPPPKEKYIHEISFRTCKSFIRSWDKKFSGWHSRHLE